MGVMSVNLEQPPLALYLALCQLIEMADPIHCRTVVRVAAATIVYKVIIRQVNSTVFKDRCNLNDYHRLYYLASGGGALYERHKLSVV